MAIRNPVLSRQAQARLHKLGITPTPTNETHSLLMAEKSFLSRRKVGPKRARTLLRIIATRKNRLTAYEREIERMCKDLGFAQGTTLEQMKHLVQALPPTRKNAAILTNLSILEKLIGITQRRIAKLEALKSGV